MKKSWSVSLIIAGVIVCGFAIHAGYERVMNSMAAEYQLGEWYWVRQKYDWNGLERERLIAKGNCGLLIFGRYGSERIISPFSVVCKARDIDKDNGK